ncbi:MAG: 23S rRNA (adenine2503-C2)-methyltransferase [Cellvibrionaceae bacterium]|jgi:23S rRNA (adenine2503-C2)-methyltransferase
MEKTDLYDLSAADLETLVKEMGQPKFRAKQLWEWLYHHFAADPIEMTNLPVALRDLIAGQTQIGNLKVVVSESSSDGFTEKVLFECHDGNLIETVLMRYDKRNTICMSSQAGCAMGCVFCATGQMGFARHLTVGEMVAQFTYFARILKAEEGRISNVVMMGMGEPLHNYDNTLAAVDRMTDPSGIDLGNRKVTISTVGLIPAMRRFADEQRQTPLAVSLHAATDEERSKLIPPNKRWPIAELIEACQYVIDKTGRRLTFEWALINGQNDTVEQAEKLGALVKGMLCHVNLIPLNPTNGFDGRPSNPERVEAFIDKLADYGVSATVRVRRGIDIQAGCGQLRNRVVNE